MKEWMVDVHTKRLQTPSITEFVEKVLSKLGEHSTDFSEHAYIGECTELDTLLN